MKKILMGSTACIGLGLIAGPAVADEPISLGLGGYFHGYGVFGEDDGVLGANRRNYKISRESEVHFKGSTSLDNGLKVGIKIELEAETCPDQIDETYMYVEGGFGRLLVGQEDPAPYVMYMGAPSSALPGHGFTVPTFQHAQTGGNAHGAIPTNLINISGDSEKLSYFSPRLGGFQLGVSYTPENCEERLGTCAGTYGGFPSTQDAGQQSEVVEIGANYTRKLGGIDFSLFGGYGEGDLEVPAAGATDQTEWSVGLRVGVLGLEVGASYHEDNLATSGSNSDQEEVLVGGSYGTGPWKLSLLYWHSRIGAGAGLGADTLDAIELGARYTLGPGVRLAGGVQYLELQDNLNVAANENEALIFILGTSVSF